MRKNRKMFDLIGVMIVTLLGKFACFVFDALLSAKYGVGIITDAFVMAHSLPTVVVDGFATAIITCYIPIATKMECEEPKQLKKYNGSTLILSFCFSAITSLVVYSFNKPILGLYAKGFDGQSLSLLIKYTKVMIWSLPFVATFAVFRAYIQVKGIKILSSVHQVLTYLVLIIALILFFPNDMSLPWATLIGNIIVFIILMVTALHYGFKVDFSAGLRNKEIKSMVYMMFPMIISTLVSEINAFADKYFSSFYETGIVTSMSYGYKFSFAIQGIIATSLMTVLYPEYSKSAAEGNIEKLKQQAYESVKLIAWIITPVVFGGVILAYPIIDLVYGHGNFTNENVTITKDIFAVYLLGVLPMCIKLVADKIGYALKKTQYAFLTSCVVVSSNIVLNIIFGRIWGYMGLVVATVISLVLGAYVNFLQLKKVDMGFSIIRVGKILVGPLLNSFIMIICVKIIYEMALIHNIVGNMFLCILVGVIIYAITMLMFFKKELMSIIEFIKIK